ncbi:hypothetical protein V5799_007401 [Amblyomma americanum]|uniref:Uncharacterized protein n=1 Tax=Amblyomma americanum TaxID=6943 RepID=A0AAQ4FI12_AMBAM
MLLLYVYTGTPQSAPLGHQLLPDHSRRHEGSSVPAASFCRRGVWSCRHQLFSAISDDRLRVEDLSVCLKLLPCFRLLEAVSPMKLALQDRGQDFPVLECTGSGITALRPFGRVISCTTAWQQHHRQ